MLMSNAWNCGFTEIGRKILDMEENKAEISAGVVFRAYDYARNVWNKGVYPSNRDTP